MGILKKLAGETAVYGLTMVLGRTLNYLMVPIYTAVFAEGKYAVQAELYSYVAFLNVLYTYGMETAFFRYATKTHLQKTFNQIVSAHLFTSLLFSMVLFLSSDALALGLGYGGQGVFLRWLAGVLALDTLSAIPLARLRLEGRAWRFGLVKLSNILLSLGLNLFFLVFCPWVQAGAWVGAQALVGWVYAPEIGVGYIFLANLLASGVQWLLLLPAYRGFRLVWHWPTFRPILWYAYPLVFTGLAAMISEVLDRPLLKYYLPDNFYPGQTALEAMGVYAACYKLSIFMSIGIQAFKYAAEPFFFTRAEDPKAPALFAQVMHYFVIVAVFVWLFVSLHLDVFKWLFLRRESYWAGVGVVPILLLANLFLGVYYNLAIWFKLTEQTYFGTWFAGAGAVITLVANLGLVPFFGYHGAAWATLMAYGTMMGLCYAYGQKHFPVPYDWVSMVKYILLAGVLILAALYLPLSPGLTRQALLEVFLLIFVSVVYFSEKGKRLLPPAKENAQEAKE